MIPIVKSPHLQEEERLLTNEVCNTDNYGALKGERCLSSSLPWSHEFDNRILRNWKQNDTAYGDDRYSNADLMEKKTSTLDGAFPSPPDGGWGWVVVAASFLCLCVLDGISYTFGIFLAPLMEDMDCGRGGTSAAGSFQIGVYSLTR